MRRRYPCSDRTLRRPGAVAAAALVSLVALGACGGGSEQAGEPPSSASEPAMPANLCTALSAALTATPDLGVDASAGTASTRESSTVVCTLTGATTQLQISATPARSGDAAGTADDLDAACALLHTSTSADFSRGSASCTTSSGAMAPGEVVSASELVDPHGLLVVHATATGDSGAILAAQVAQLEFTLGSTLPRG